MTWSGKKVLVTGAAGFLGSNLVDSLVSAGAIVTALDSLHSGTLANLGEAQSRIAFREGDVRDQETVLDATRGQEVVFHLAANADVPYSVEHPQFDFDVNVIGSHNIMRACMANDVGRLVFASSAAVYGDPVYTPMDEDHPLRPVSPYGASKLAAENLGFAYHKTFGYFAIVLALGAVASGLQQYWIPLLAVVVVGVLVVLSVLCVYLEGKGYRQDTYRSVYGNHPDNPYNKLREGL